MREEGKKERVERRWGGDEEKKDKRKEGSKRNRKRER